MAGDVISMIKSDHREVERMFSLKEDASARPLVLPLAVAVVTAHSRAEEDHAYPVLAAEAGEADEARHSMHEHEHEQAGQLGRQLLAEDPASREFAGHLEEFMTAVQHHVQEEEEDEILPALAGAVDGERLREMGLDFAARRAQELTGQHFGSGSGDAGASRQELYEQARKLDIPGRSSMTKEELAREVGRQQPS